MSPNIDDNNTDRNIRESIDKKESKLATLKVAEAEQRDVGRKIALTDGWRKKMTSDVNSPSIA